MFSYVLDIFGHKPNRVITNCSYFDWDNIVVWVIEQVVFETINSAPCYVEDLAHSHELDRCILEMVT